MKPLIKAKKAYYRETALLARRHLRSNRINGCFAQIGENLPLELFGADNHAFISHVILQYNKDGTPPNKASSMRLDTALTKLANDMLPHEDDPETKEEAEAMAEALVEGDLSNVIEIGDMVRHVTGKFNNSPVMVTVSEETMFDDPGYSRPLPPGVDVEPGYPAFKCLWMLEDGTRGEGIFRAEHLEIYQKGVKA